MANDGPVRTVTYLLVQAEPGSDPWHSRPEVSAVLNEVLHEHAGSRLEDWYSEEGTGAVFQRAPDAVTAALAFRRRLGAPLSIQLRLGLHSGAPEPWDQAAPGGALERCAGIVALAHGGQTLLTADTAAQVQHALPSSASLQPLGRHRLRDLRSVEQVVQLNLDEAVDFGPLRSLEALPNNLPVQVTSFIGRRREVAELKRHIASSRLVTLSGPGGSGKTRMALQVGAELLDQFPDGVWMVDLSSLSDKALVAQAAATALKLREEPGRSHAETLCAALADRQLLLVLDNCEHVITSCARLASSLLTECPQVKILATSREPLGIAGETAWLIPTLSAPDPRGHGPADAIARYEAVRLFADRARAVSPSFAVTEQNAAAVANVCSRLDGVPLALELAAARTRVLSVEQIAERLDDRLRLLTSGHRTTLPRHQTLRAAIDWSHDLLSDMERMLWRRLSVFAGSFSLGAVETICAGDEIDPLDVLDVLSQLVDKCLVVAEERQGQKRFRLLETMRQYAQERLQESGEEPALRGALCGWYGDLLERHDPEHFATVQWMDKIELEHDNLRQAVHWAMETGHWDQALRICSELWFFWHVRGYTLENYDKVIRLADMDCPSGCERQMGKLLRGAGAFTYYRGQFGRSQSYHGRALAIEKQLGNRAEMAQALNNLGVTAQAQGKMDDAREYLLEAVRIHEELGNQVRGAWARSNLGSVYLEQGEYAVARRLNEESLAAQRQAGDDAGMALSHEYLGFSALGEGDCAEAQAHLDASLTIRRALGDKRGMGATLTGLGQLALYRQEYGHARQYLTEALRHRHAAGDWSGMVLTLETMAWVAAAEGKAALALQLAGGADALRRQTHLAVPPVRAALMERQMTPARRTLSAEAAREAFAAGAQLAIEDLLELSCTDESEPAQQAAPAAASNVPEAPPLRDSGLDALTPRETEIVRFLAQGLTAREIGQRLYLSPRTVEKHEENIRTKLEVPNRAALVVWAIRRGLGENA